MKRPRIIIAGLGLAALAAAGGITAASASGTPAARTTSAATVSTAQATVAGKTETILVNNQGLPLYIYRPDTATTSLVTGGLAQLWPPLTSPAIAGAGVTGKVAVLRDVNGQQITYNGHPLYTFAGDQAGQVTGQGVQNFFVATPGIASIIMPAGSTARSTPAAPSGGYGY
jgi:predicted lipoprotein with Yx(FWY)xxD motif